MNDGDHKIDADGDPDLSLHRVGTRPVVMFDAQVPLDPAEEQLDPPTQAIKCCDGQCRNEQIVCQENQIAPGLRVEVSHPPQIDLRMHLDPGFRLAEIGPWEKRQRQIDGGRVERVDRVLDVEADFLPGVKRSRFGHEALGQILPEPPVALLVGIGQRGFGNRFAKTQMVTRMRFRV